MLNRKKESLLVVTLFAALLVVAATLAFPSHGQSGAASTINGQSAQDGSTRPRTIADASKTTDPTKVSDADKLAATGATASTTNTTNSTNAVVAAAPDSTAASSSATNSTVAVNAAASVAFADAAKQNLVLREGLDWVFGGKQQRGWSIYEPLIARTVAVEAGSESNEFASAVSRWQTSFGLQSSGVLDRDTWMKLVADWQSRRLKDHTYPTPDQLVTVAPAEFYDPARPAELRQVERTTYAAYKRMLAAAAADKSLGLKLDANGELADSEKFLKIVSAFRSREYQDRLRQQQPGAGRAALAVNSPHFTGRALDLYVGGYDPVSTKDDNRALQTQTKAYKWLVKNAETFGFRPYYFEPWHWEYVGN